MSESLNLKLQVICVTKVGSVKKNLKRWVLEKLKLLLDVYKIKNLIIK